MQNRQHPSLARLYACRDDDLIAYVDETYLSLSEDEENAFYAITAAIYEKRELPSLRNDLIDIVNGLFNKPYPYWHSTEALRTARGRAVFEDLLSYIRDCEDKSFVTCKTKIDGSEVSNEPGRKTVGPEERARRACFGKLFEVYLQDLPSLSGLVVEKRETTEDDDRDRSFFKRLRKEGLMPSRVGRAWVSPSDEVALWVPDIVSMAFRRMLTHQGKPTSHLFEKYLSDVTDVHFFESFEAFD